MIYQFTLEEEIVFSIFFYLGMIVLFFFPKSYRIYLPMFFNCFLVVIGGAFGFYGKLVASFLFGFEVCFFSLKPNFFFDKGGKRELKSTWEEPKKGAPSEPTLEQLGINRLTQEEMKRILSFESELARVQAELEKGLDELHLLRQESLVRAVTQNNN